MIIAIIVVAVIVIVVVWLGASQKKQQSAQEQQQAKQSTLMELEQGLAIAGLGGTRSGTVHPGTIPSKNALFGSTLGIRNIPVTTKTTS